ncbi:hypothetical protein [Nocardioides jensenii]|nr:hypothetical protein [Nocardioides jensenii]
MAWLFGQLWFLILLAFLVGALLTYAVVALALPHVDDLEAETGARAEGGF